jgi:ATP-dependent Clp protease ATP-binding subunit ClpA
MTTNAGAQELSAGGIGFQANTSGKGQGRGAIERTFSPEFRNRLDAWIAFSSLSFEVIEKVVDKFIKELNAQLAEKKVRVVLDEAARAWLASRGFDRLFGARPMGRLIQTKIKEPLAEELLFGASLAEGGEVSVHVTDDELKLGFPSAAS